MENWINAFSVINLKFLMQGLVTTIEVSLISIVFSFMIGLILGLINYSKIPFLSVLVNLLTDLIRNIPLLLIIFLAYFGLPEIGLRVEPFWATIIALVIFESAMVSELVRSGIMAVDSGQMEGALSNGMTYWQAMRYVVLPQALLLMIPAMLSQFVSLVKDTSLATIIVLPELLYHAQIIYSQNSSYMIPMYLAISVLYFMVCFLLSLFAKHLSKKFGTSELGQ